MKLYFHKSISVMVIKAFVVGSLYAPPAMAGEVVVPIMPAPGSMVALSPAFIPAHLKGITVNPNDPLKFDFLVHKGDGNLDLSQKNEEYTKLVKYFLAALAVPDQDQWVNLSPYEKNRIIDENFGKTEMGRDLLSQDYLLKQITSSLMYPESGLGKSFWDKVYERAQKEFGTTNIPVNTFNKVWITPSEVVIYEAENSAYVLKTHLKVMLEEDYLAKDKSSSVIARSEATKQSLTQSDKLTQNVIKQIILPELEKEVNEGKNFAMLRQIVNSMALAAWFKQSLKESLLAQVYANKAKVEGINLTDPKKAQAELYQQYLTAFKKGVYNYVKDVPATGTGKESLPRKYFAGGFSPNSQAMIVRGNADPVLLSQFAGNFKAFDNAAISLAPADRAMSNIGSRANPLVGAVAAFVLTFSPVSNAFAQAPIAESSRLAALKELLGTDAPASIKLTQNLLEDPRTMFYKDPEDGKIQPGWVLAYLRIGDTLQVTFKKINDIGTSFLTGDDGTPKVVYVNYVGSPAELDDLTARFRTALGDKAQLSLKRRGFLALTAGTAAALLTSGAQAQQRSNTSSLPNLRDVMPQPSLTEMLLKTMGAAQNYFVHYRIPGDNRRFRGVITKVEQQGDIITISVDRIKIDKTGYVLTGGAKITDTLKFNIKDPGVGNIILAEEEFAPVAPGQPGYPGFLGPRITTVYGKPVVEYGPDGKTIRIIRFQKGRVVDALKAYSFKNIPNALDILKKERIIDDSGYVIGEVTSQVQARIHKIFGLEGRVIEAAVIRSARYGLEVRSIVFLTINGANHDTVVPAFVHSITSMDDGGYRVTYIRWAEDGRPGSTDIIYPALTTMNDTQFSPFFPNSVRTGAGEPFSRLRNSDGTEANPAMNSSIPTGGIDLNSSNYSLLIKRDGKGRLLPFKLQDMAQLGSIDGFLPEVLSIVPAVMPGFLSQLNTGNPVHQALASNR